MTWIIDGITLPIDPASAERRVLRKQQANQILSSFPLPFDIGPQAFELTLKGLIWPPSKAKGLWEQTKVAEAESIQIQVINDPDHLQYEGRYAVNKESVKQDGPKFTKDAGAEVPVSAYDITFVQFGESSAIGDGDGLDLDLDEDGVGFDIEDVFGAFDFDSFINTINQFFTV